MKWNRIWIAACLVLARAGQETAGQVRADGATRIFFTNAPASTQNAAFSPDGGTILLTVFHQGYNNGPAGIFSVAVTGAVARAVIDEADQDSVNLPGSCWNGLSNRIAFSSDRADKHEVWTMNPTGGALFRVTNHAGTNQYIEPTFSSNGQWLVFEDHPNLDDDNAQGSLWRVRCDGAGLTQLTDGPGGGTDDRQPNWSPAADRILFQRRSPAGEDWNLYLIDTNGVITRQVTTSTASDTDASWSPDGLWIAYSTDHGGLPVPNLFVISSTGGPPVRVTNNSTNDDAAPSWSPDGRWIAFESHKPGDTAPAALWRIAAPADLDFDQDGLPDWWEQSNFGNPTSALPGADSDTDAVVNLDEYCADTQPTNPASVFRINAISNDAGRLIFFPTSTQRIYDVYYAVVPTHEAWSDLKTNIPGVGGMLSVTDAAPDIQRVYRLKAIRP